MASTLAHQRCLHRPAKALLGLAFLVVLKALIQGEIEETNQSVHVLQGARNHIVGSLAKYQVPSYEENEENAIKGVKIEIPFSCSIYARNVAITIRVPSVSLAVPEDVIYANVCLKAIGNVCPPLQEIIDKYRVSVSVGLGVTHYHYPLCRKLRPRFVVLFQTNQSKVPAPPNCSVHVSISRRLPRIPEGDSTLLTCAFFQSCTFVFNERLPCGIHDFADSPRWLEASQQLNAADAPTLSSLRDLYKDRVYPLWLLPCVDACSSSSQCFWHQAKLLQFTFDANRDSDYLEASGTADCNSESGAFRQVFTPTLPEAAWTQVRGHLNNSAILFVGDSTLRGLMYALLSKLNGSLRYWEASHDQLTFESLAGGSFQRTTTSLVGRSTSTVIAFAYFPLFWRRKPQQRTLIGVISQSLGRIAKENVDLVIGGTQWLGTGQMKQLSSYLFQHKGRRIRRIIVKSHQAGFHVPNYLTHHFSLDEHLQRKRQMSEETWRLRGKFKWAGIDAYYLTWSSLYHFAADFQCSCHFHTTILNANLGEYVISGEVIEALLQSLVYNILNANKA